MINGKVLRNLEAVPYMSQMMPSVKEYWTPSPQVDFLYYSFLEHNNYIV